MKSRQDYIDTYRNIAKGLNIYGDTAEVLIQLLAETTYISEVEHAVYMQEASLEKAALMNSKIQHCMNDMYSVFRGSCPRVILRFHPTKYFDLNPFDEIVTGSGFKVYYLGFWKGTGEEVTIAPEVEISALTTGFEYGPKIIPPGLINNPEDPEYEVYTIIGLLAKEVCNQSYVTDYNNTYYVECREENLSSDLWVKIEGSYKAVTRNFSGHITDAKVFDLTLPSFGSRLYIADILRSGNYRKDYIETQENLEVEALWYKYSLLSDYNDAELRRMNVKGSIPVSFGGEFQGSEEISPGVIIVEEGSRDTVSTIHYKANRDRYVNSIIRTNSDVGIVLEETFPEYIKTGGTSYKFTGIDDGSSLEIFYVPKNERNLLREEDIVKFRETKSGYYVTTNLVVTPGTKYTAIFNLDLELYQATSIEEEVKNILFEYEDSFGVNLEEKSDEIKSLISKISNVKQISGYDIDYVDGNGQVLSDEGREKMFANLESSYYKINYVINSSIQNIGL